MVRKLLTNCSWKQPAALLAGVLLLGSVLVIGNAEAEEVPRLSLHDVLRMLADDPIVPQEWAGIWSIVDSTFTCDGQLQDFDTGTDTLCTGDPVIPTEGEGPVTNVSCSGTVTATSATITCTGSTEVFTDCLAVLTSETQAFRNGDTYTATVETRITYAGIGLGCSAFPSFCQETRTHGTRVAGEPPDCSATAVEEASWGLVKRLYR
jgi:hypothetical protein